MSFAKRFAYLVKTRRGVEGMTQQELAVAAFGDENAKAQISKIENAHVEKPQQKTIDALAVSLNLTPEDIEACHAPIAPDIPDGVREEIGLHRNLLETLALRFRHDDPDAATPELERYLKDKAKEHETLQKRFDELAENENRWANQLAAAKSLIADGQFDEADEILATAEEFQQEEKTLVEVRKQADLRATRGEAALLKGDADTACTHYAAAADMVGMFNVVEGAERRDLLAQSLYFHGKRYGGDALDQSEKLFRVSCENLGKSKHPNAWANAQNSHAIALRNQATRTQGEAGAALFAQAVAAYEAALTVHTQADHPLDWAMTQNNLAIALRNQASRTQGEAGAALFAQAVTASEAALTVCTRADHPLDWAMTQNNLAIALRNQASRTQGEAGAALFAQAVAAYEAALKIYTQADHPVQWAMTQNNLGAALRNQASRTQGEAGAALFAQAVAAYEAALTIYTQADHPVDWAMTQNNLGNALQEQGTRTQGEAGAALFAQAVAAYEAALTVYTQADHPVQWAMTQMNIGLACTAMAERDETDARTHLDRALTAFDTALTVFDPEHTSYYFEKCTAARKYAAAKRAALS